MFKFDMIVDAKNVLKIVILEMATVVLLSGKVQSLNSDNSEAEGEKVRKRKIKKTSPLEEEW